MSFLTSLSQYQSHKNFHATILWTGGEVLQITKSKQKLKFIILAFYAHDSLRVRE